MSDLPLGMSYKETTEGSNSESSTYLPLWLIVSNHHPTRIAYIM